MDELKEGDESTLTSYYHSLRRQAFSRRLLFWTRIVFGAELGLAVAIFVRIVQHRPYIYQSAMSFAVGLAFILISHYAKVANGRRYPD